MTWLEELYPDVREAGGLSELLQPIVHVPMEVRRERGVEHSASVVSPPPLRQKTSVDLGIEKRVFVVQLWAERAHLAVGSSAELVSIAGLIDDFHSSDDVGPVLERHSFLKISSVGRAYLSGSEVEWWWSHLLNQRDDAVASLPRLRDAIRATSREPKLRQLRPFTSHDDLCFSAVTRYPWSGHLPTLRTYAVDASHHPDRVFVYEVLEPGRREPVASTDSAEEAAATAAALVPEDLGPAIPGSADDL